MAILMLDRRYFIGIVGFIVLLSHWAMIEVASGATTERTKREFMELALEDINGQRTQIREQIKKSKKEGRGAPLFVQIPLLIPFIDFDYWYIDRDLRWEPPKGSSLPSVKVPKGFVSDLASVPAFLWGKYPPIGRYAYAAVVHDYLYWSQTTSREIADEILVIAMQDAETDESAVKRFNFVLRKFGGKAWSDNQEAKTKGEKRVIGIFPTDRLMSWEIFKSMPGVFKD